MRFLLRLPAYFLLMLWPLLVLMSPMIFGAPGATSDKSNLLTLAITLFYPVLIGVIFFLLGWHFLSFSPRVFLILSIALPVSVFVLFGYARITVNMFRGIITQLDTCPARASSCASDRRC